MVVEAECPMLESGGRSAELVDGGRWWTLCWWTLEVGVLSCAEMEKSAVGGWRSEC